MRPELKWMQSTAAMNVTETAPSVPPLSTSEFGQVVSPISRQQTADGAFGVGFRAGVRTVAGK